MRDPFKNPFPSSDTARHSIWEMLVPRDIDAFLAADWSMVEHDFVEDGFIGIDGRKEGQPRQVAPGISDTVGLSRRMAAPGERLRHADRFAEDTRTAIFTTTTLEDIEIEGDMALVRKKFDGGLTKSRRQPRYHAVADTLLLPAARGTVEDLRLHRLPAEPYGLKQADKKAELTCGFSRQHWRPRPIPFPRSAWIAAPLRRRSMRRPASIPIRRRSARRRSPSVVGFAPKRDGS